MNFFDFLYCCFYKWSERVNGKGYPHKHSASIMMSFILMLIGGALLTAWAVLSEIDIEAVPFGRVLAGLFPVGIFLIVNFYFTSNDRYVKALKAFDASASTFRVKPGLVVALALGTSLGFVFTVWWVLSK